MSNEKRFAAKREAIHSATERYLQQYSIDDAVMLATELGFERGYDCARRIHPTREEVANIMLFQFTAKLPTCGNMTILEFAEKLGAREALGVLCRQYGWDVKEVKWLENKE